MFWERNPILNRTRVINVKTKEQYDVFIGRPSIWGNPFKVGVHGDRQRCIILYEDWLKKQPELMARIPELRGKVLACYCKPLACHGEVLARLADFGAR